MVCPKSAQPQIISEDTLARSNIHHNGKSQARTFVRSSNIHSTTIDAADEE